MNVHEFVSKWGRSTLTERSAAQQHFLDLCELIGHPKPAAADPTGESFTFEGWEPTLTDEEILEKLLALNLARDSASGNAFFLEKGPPVN